MFSFARPHLGKLIVFLVLSVIGAVLTVATPVIAGQHRRRDHDRRRARSVVTLAIAIAVIAVAAAAFGMIAAVGVGADRRRASSSTCAGAVFGHVQRMPVAFFTRTRTGALVSRLNNDVIGAQRAFTSTLSGVVTNSSPSC